jgi:hypothetical protein
MEVFGEIFSSLANLWMEMIGELWKVLPKALSFTFWVVAAIFILPCVYICAIFYPMWQKWGEDL